MVCNESKPPRQFFRERTLKSEAPMTSPSNRHWPVRPRSSRP